MADDKTTKILKLFQLIVPRLSDSGKDRLLSYGEGMLAILRDMQEATEPAQ